MGLFEVCLWQTIPLESRHLACMLVEMWKRRFFRDWRGKKLWNKGFEIGNLTRFEMLRENVSLVMPDRLDERECDTPSAYMCVCVFKDDSRYNLQNYGKKKSSWQIYVYYIPAINSGLACAHPRTPLQTCNLPPTDSAENAEIYRSRRSVVTSNMSGV